VYEHNAVGLVLATVTAIDPDAGENASLNFNFRRCTPASVTSPVMTSHNVTSLAVTSLNSSSALVVAGTSYDLSTHGPLHQCFLSVCDRGAVTSLCADDVIVRIHVTERRRRPRFDRTAAGYYFSVAANHPAGALVGQLWVSFLLRREK